MSALGVPICLRLLWHGSSPSRSRGGWRSTRGAWSSAARRQGRVQEGTDAELAGFPATIAEGAAPGPSLTSDHAVPSR